MPFNITWFVHALTIINLNIISSWLSKYSFRYYDMHNYSCSCLLFACIVRTVSMLGSGVYWSEITLCFTFTLHCQFWFNQFWLLTQIKCCFIQLFNTQYCPNSTVSKSETDICVFDDSLNAHIHCYVAKSVPECPRVS